MENLKSKARLSIKQIVAVCFVFALSLAVFVTASYFMTYEPNADITDVPFNTNIPTDSTHTGTVAPGTYVPDKTKKAYNFLVIGHDRVAVLADVIMLVNYNITDGTLAIMQIPRDTYLNDGSWYRQVNAAFSSYYSNALTAGSKNPTSDALKKFTSVLEKNLCININYSAVMNLEGFINIVDIIGGVEVDVPYELDYDDPFQNLSIHINKGRQTLTGAQAEGFVRFRNSFVQADIGRGNMQKIFMAAFIKKLISSVEVSNVSKIAGEIMKNITTDLGVDDIVYFGKHALNLKLSSITMMTLPSGVSSTGGIVLNRKAMLDAVNKYYNLYSEDISAAIFDPGRVFCPTEDDYSNGLYYSDTPQINYVYNAQKIIDDSIYIPIIQN